MTQACQLPVMFDPNQYQIATTGAFIRVSGKYPVIITDAVMKAVQGNAAAHYIQFTLEITDGELKGQTFVDRLNINNPKESTREIAMKSLTSYATAIGQQQAFADAAILCRRPFQLFVEAVEEPSTTDPNKTNWNNSVKKWYYANGDEIQQGKFGSINAAGTPPAGYGAPQPQAVPQPQAAPVQQAVPQPQAAPAQQYAPQAAAPAAPAPQQQYAPQAAAQAAPPAGQVTINAQGYGAPAGAPPAAGGYVPPAAPSFAPPQQ